MRYLGQHFLKNKNIVKKIVDLAELSKDDTVLEVGPGKGILTEEILNRVGKVVAVEKDKHLCEFLNDKFSEEIKKERLILMEGDVLKIYGDELARIASRRKALRRLSGHGSCRRQESETEQQGAIATLGRLTPSFHATNPSLIFTRTKNYKIVANIPYYITSRFLKIFLEEVKFQPQKMVLMVQKEVAERICETPPKSILAVSVQVYGAPKIAFKVSAGNFSPSPKVDSTVIIINDISKKFFSGVNENSFFNIVKIGFSKKRKILINNLSKGLNEEKEDLEIAFKKCGINVLSRAENLSLQNWKCLSLFLTAE